MVATKAQENTIGTIILLLMDLDPLNNNLMTLIKSLINKIHKLILIEHKLAHRVLLNKNATQCRWLPFHLMTYQFYNIVIDIEENLSSSKLILDLTLLDYLQMNEKYLINNTNNKWQSNYSKDGLNQWANVMILHHINIKRKSRMEFTYINHDSINTLLLLVLLF